VKEKNDPAAKLIEETVVDDEDEGNTIIQTDECLIKF
jgi:hypothetical protein